MDAYEILEQNEVESLEDLVSLTKKLTDEFIRKNSREATPSECGLDRRCGTLFMHATFVAVDIDDNRLLQYYGGFEYVNKSHVHYLGDYVVYSTEDSRVMEAFDQYEQNTLTLKGKDDEN